MSLDSCARVGCHNGRIGRAFRGTTRAAALSTFAFSARTHAILLIVSGSFVLETSSSCGLVVPMRALPRPMGRHRVPLVFAVDVAVTDIVLHLFLLLFLLVACAKIYSRGLESEEERA